MKYLIVIAVVVVVAWIATRGRKSERPTGHGRTRTTPQTVVQCSHCGVHLPRDEALIDDRGVFCSQAHRLAGPRD